MASEAVEIGCLSIRLAIVVVLVIVFAIGTIVLFPIMCLVWLMIPFLFI